MYSAPNPRPRVHARHPVGIILRRILVYLTITNSRVRKWSIPMSNVKKVAQPLMVDIHHDLKDEHPVKRWLLSYVSKFGADGGNIKVQDAVLKHGYPFIGIKRPKEYRPRARKKCFLNAGDIASSERRIPRPIYVEGFAIRPIGGTPFHHAWITLDGIHAIDVTLRDPAPDCLYFGIPFSLEVLQRRTVRRGGKLTLIVPYDSDEEIEELLKDAVCHPPIFPEGVKYSGAPSQAQIGSQL
jgi:hypothetical protein